jgi:large subunit ribosomal protein L5
MRLKEKYNKEIIPKMKEKFGFKNTMLVPHLTKVVLNVGFGHHAKDKEFMAAVSDGLARITGQKSIFTAAKKSISAFKVREGLIIGAKVTLRGQRMYDFTDKLVNITFPRVRDFRGISEKSIDKSGNLTVGFKEHIAFPEIKIENVNSVYGLEVCLVTDTNNQAQGLELFRLLGFPFKKESK